MKTIFSSNRKYRYTLWRQWYWPLRQHVMFVGLNPSTADETQDDPTVRRCIRYAMAWGFDGLMMMNAFAFRATDPRVMIAEPEPVGPANDFFLRVEAQRAGLVVVAWGTRARHLNRHNQLLSGPLHRMVHCLQQTKDGYPKHPLYLRKDLKPVPYYSKTA